jgi:sugar diacid utilization regulator
MVQEPGEARAAEGADAELAAGEALRHLLDERPEEMAAALAVVRRVTSNLDLDVVLTESVALAMAVARCQVGAIYLLNEDDQRLWIRATSPGYERLIGNYSLEVGAGLTGWTALNRTPAMVGDHLHDDPRYVPVPEVDLEFRSALTYPMISPSGALVGVITLHTKGPREFSENDLVAVRPIAALAAAAVETAQLYSRSRRQVDVLRSIGTVGDALASPAATRRALRSLGEAARLLLGGEVVALYTREGAGWRLNLALTDAPYPPQEQVEHAMLDALASGGDPVALDLGGHRDLFEAILPGDDRVSNGIAARLDAGAETVGLLICLGGRQVVSATDRELFSVIATVSATVIQSGRLVDRLAARDPRRAFLEGVTDESEPPGVLAARARQLGVDLDEPQVAAWFRVADEGSGETEPERALELLGEELGERFPGSVASLRGVELLALLRANGDGAADDVRDALGRIESETGQGLIGGLSGPVRHLERYAPAFREAHDAIQIGQMTAGAGRVIDFDELGAQRHLWALARSSTRDPFQERLEVLQRHDVEHGTGYLDTIDAFLGAYGNREQAAAALRIHRNTLRQRIEKVRELSGIDLEDKSTIFEVQTALGILRFREFQRAEDSGGEPADDA